MSQLGSGTHSFRRRLREQTQSYSSSEKMNWRTSRRVFSESFSPATIKFESTSSEKGQGRRGVVHVFLKIEFSNKSIQFELDPYFTATGCDLMKLLTLIAGFSFRLNVCSLMKRVA